MDKFHTEGVAPSWLQSAAAQVVAAADRQDQLVFERGQLVQETALIGTVIYGGDVDGLGRYLFGPGRANEHTEPRIIDGWRTPQEVEPHVTIKGTRDLRPLVQKLHAPNQLMRTPRDDYVWHVPLSPAEPINLVLEVG